MGPCLGYSRNGNEALRAITILDIYKPRLLKYQSHRDFSVMELEAALGTCESRPVIPLSFLHSVPTLTDVDECQEYGPAICGAQRCENTPGSYRCTPACDPGYQPTLGGGCQGGCPSGSR